MIAARKTKLQDDMFERHEVLQKEIERQRQKPGRKFGLSGSDI